MESRTTFKLALPEGWGLAAIAAGMAFAIVSATSAIAQSAAPLEKQQPPTVFLPWTKLCVKDEKQGEAEVCLTVMDARLKTGQVVAGAALVEKQGEQQKTMRITLPLGMRLSQAPVIIVDQDSPIAGRYEVCLPTGCRAEFNVDQEFVGKLKNGQTLLLQGTDTAAHMVSFPLPLANFAKANEGPPTDPKVFETMQKKLLKR